MAPENAADAVRGRIVTFYSYKGGVGRSMLLANVGALLARWGHKVLLIDFDLEAPGLDAFFKTWLPGARKDSPGVVDMLHEIAQGKNAHWRQFVTPVGLTAGRRIDLMHAGRDDRDYAGKLAGLNWETLFRDRDLGQFLELWRQAMLAGKDGYDYVLIDSRTGITDIGGICTIHLPDVLVGLVTTTDQSLSGLKTAMNAAAAGHATFPVERERLVTLALASRDESARAYEKAREWRERFATELGDLLWWKPVQTGAADVFDWLRIPYETHWSFGEQLPVLEEEVENPKNLSYSYFQVAQLLVSGFDWGVVKSRAASQSEAVAQLETQLREEFDERTDEMRAGRKRALLIGAMGSLALLMAGAAFVYKVSADEARAEAARASAETQLIREREQAAKRAQDLRVATLAYGTGHQEIAARNYASAVVHFERAIKLDPDMADAYRSLGVALDGRARSPGISDSERRAYTDASLKAFVDWVRLAPTPSRRAQVAEAAVAKDRLDIAVAQGQLLLGELRAADLKTSAAEMLKAMTQAQAKGGSSPAGQQARALVAEFNQLLGRPGGK